MGKYLGKSIDPIYFITDVNDVIFFVFNIFASLLIELSVNIFSPPDVMTPHMMPMQQPDLPALPNKILFLTQLPPETTQMMLAMLFNQ